MQSLTLTTFTMFKKIAMLRFYHFFTQAYAQSTVTGKLLHSPLSQETELCTHGSAHHAKQTPTKTDMCADPNPVFIYLSHNESKT